MVVVVLCGAGGGGGFDVCFVKCVAKAPISVAQRLG